MATYYISATIDGEAVVYAMNATESIRSSESGTLSSHRLESGNIASDNYRSSPQIVSIRGRISDVFVGNNIAQADRKTTKKFIEGLRYLKNNAIAFTVHYSSDLTPLTPCFFTALDLWQDGENGFSGVNRDGEHINTYLLDMEIQVARIAQAAIFTQERSADIADSTQSKTSSSRSTKSVDENTNEYLIDAYSNLITAEEARLQSSTGF